MAKKKLVLKKVQNSRSSKKTKAAPKVLKRSIKKSTIKKSVSNISETILVLLETSFLRSISYRDPNFSRLLELSRQGKVKLCMSRITFHEWRTAKREDLISAIKKLKSDTEGLIKSWEKNPITMSKAHTIQASLELMPNENDLEQHSTEWIEDFCKTYLVEILEPTEQHIKQTWELYFSGRPPFKNIKERLDIPDAWIYVAALSKRESYGSLYCLIGNGDKNSGDKHLALSLREAKCEVSNDLLELLRRIDTPEPTTPGGNGLNIGKPLAALAAEEEPIKIRILGYVHWFDGISKSDLFSILQSKGHSKELVEGLAKRLSLTGYIKDVGNTYLPLNVDACRDAAQQIKPELIEALEKSDETRT